MGFRDHFRTAKRSDDRTSSISSSASTVGKNTNGTTTPTHTIDHPSPLSTTKTHTADGKDASPSITLTKSHSRLGKTLTWHGSSKPSKKEAAKDKQLKAWAKEDAVEWTSPMSHRPGKKNAECQNTLRAFDFRKAALGGMNEGEGKGRSLSACSGVSPSASRVGSVDDGLTLGQMKEKRNSSDKVRPGKLSQEIVRDGGEKGVVVEKEKMQGVREE